MSQLTASKPTEQERQYRQLVNIERQDRRSAWLQGWESVLGRCLSNNSPVHMAKHSASK